ncbi:MAG: XRE family transcriptional regulator [Peptostreptococcus sp.]|uniref:hypothetical protein n=1 Tax=Peptostreptococcus sp. TaxID=1262 RepID=UPI002FC76FC2
MNRIKALMEEKKLTINILAAALNIDDYDLELAISSNNIDKYIDPMLIGELARVLDVEVAELY